MYNFIGHRKIFLTISGALLVISIISLAVFGLKPGIDFTGGSMMELDFTYARPNSQEVQEALNQFDLGKIKIQSTGSKGMILRFKNVDEKVHQSILKAIKEIESIQPSQSLESEVKQNEINIDNKVEDIKGLKSIKGVEIETGQAVDIEVEGFTVNQSFEESSAVLEELRFESIGPVIGEELTRKTRWAILFALGAIVLYIAWAFRKLAKIAKNESWRYGAGALLALAHDVIILLGFFSIMGFLKGTEINAAFITAILTVLGYSVNDTIVVYDRIRENLLTHSHKTMEETVNYSLNETIIRSLNTSITTLFALIVIYLFGGASIRDFVLAMIVGIAAGTWSSIAIATSFLLFKRKR